MKSPRALVCLGLLAFAALLPAQAPPTAYTIVEALPGGPGQGTMTVYRSGTKAVVEYNHLAQPDGTPASRSLTLYDFTAGSSYSWDPAATPIACSAGTFSGDWGDPYGMTAQVTGSIAKGDLKPAGAETVNGIPTQVYSGTSGPTSIKAWLDQKDSLVIRAAMGAPGGPMQTIVDVKKVSLIAPPASLFALPPACAGVHPPPTAADLIGEETGDSASNFVSAIEGPGSKNSCSLILRVVQAKTMVPIADKFQVAIDTTYDQESPNPPSYEFGVGDDGTATFKGGGIHEITSQIHNGILRIDNPPAYFNLSLNIVKPGSGAGMGLIYRQCFAPQTVLLYIVKDPANPGAGGDWLYAKSGKYSTVPAH